MAKNEKEIKINCHKDHRQRMRAKIQSNGFASLEDHEKLEVLMYYTIPRANTNEQGHRLIDRFGSFSAVLDAPLDEIEKVEGIGHSTAYFLSLLPQVVGCYINDKNCSVGEFNTIDDIGRYMTTKFHGCNVEKTYIICLDSKNKILREQEISSGSANSVEFNFPEITKIALEMECHSIVLAHNHPGGVCLPSGEDIDASNILRETLRTLKINFIQHFVVVNDSYCGIFR